MRHYVVVPQFDYSGAPWHGGTPTEQGYNVLPIPNLKRPGAKDNEYYVYQNETEYKAIEADSAVSAIIASQIECPYKVIHAHVRLGDVIEPKKLDLTGKNSDYMEKHGYKGSQEHISIINVKEKVQKDSVIGDVGTEGITLSAVQESNATTSLN